MGKLISKVFTGEMILVEEMGFNKSSLEKVNQLSGLKEIFILNLTDSQRKDFEYIMAKANEITHLDNVYAYTYGYKIGSKLMLELFE
jgi:hypothetical protein